MQKLHGYSDKTRVNLTLDLPYFKHFDHTGKGGLPYIPYVHNKEKKTCPELLITGAVMRNKHQTDHVYPSVVVDGKSLNLPKTLQDLLLAHPLPRSQGPLRMPLYSNTVTGELQAKTLFIHNKSQSCAMWVPCVKGNIAWFDNHGLVTYKVVDLVVEIQGVAMMRTKRNILYTCTPLRCVIECPCNI